MGIGTSSPANKLDVNGDVRITDGTAHKRVFVREVPSASSEIVVEIGPFQSFRANMLKVKAAWRLGSSTAARYVSAELATYAASSAVDDVYLRPFNVVENPPNEAITFSETDPKSLNILIKISSSSSLTAPLLEIETLTYSTIDIVSITTD